MGRKTVKLLPQTERLLAQMGAQIRLARLRRRYSASLIAERAGISRATLIQVEKGAPSVAIGIYASVLLSLSLHDDLLFIAKDDVLGHKLQDLHIETPKRAPKET